MGIPCSCSRPSRNHQQAFQDAVQLRSSSVLTGADVSLANEHSRAQLLSYLKDNEGGMNPKLTVLYQKAINFPSECLSEFTLESCSLKDLDWAHFSTLIFYGRSATKLQLSEVAITARGFDFLCGYLEMMRKLTDLVLTDLSLGSYDFRAVAAAIGKLHRLRSLNLRANDLDCEHIALLAPAIVTLLHLQECVLDDNEVEDKGCAVLAPYLGKMHALRVLSLRRNGISTTGTMLLQQEKGKKLKVVVDGSGDITAEKPVTQ